MIAVIGENDSGLATENRGTDETLLINHQNSTTEQLLKPLRNITKMHG